MITPDTKRILIIRLSSLGDILLTTPLARSIKKQYPSITLDYLTGRQFPEVVKFNPYIDNIYYHDKAGSNDDLYYNLLHNKYNLIVDLHNNFRTRAIVKKLNVPFVRYIKPTLRKFLLVKFKWNLLRNEKPVPERYAEVLPGIKLDNEGLDFYSDSDNPEARKDDKLIGLCPGSKHFTKMWLLEYYAEFGNTIIKNGYKVVLLGGKDDKFLCDMLEKEIIGSVNKCNDNNLFETSREMSACSAIVCNDSGLMHLASALQVPVITIFGSSVKEFGFQPYKVKNLVLENNSLSCRPCSHIGRSKCPKKHFRCMKEITPQILFNNFIEFTSTHD